MIVLSTVGLIKKILLYKNELFFGTIYRSRNKVKVELDLSNYAAKSDLKNATGVDKSKFVEKDNFVDL